MIMDQLYTKVRLKYGTFYSIYSDSEPELKKKDQPLQPQSDTETREAYKRIQKGGDIPYEGLHFPVPPKKGTVLTFVCVNGMPNCCLFIPNSVCCHDVW